MIDMTHVDGREIADVKLYKLSTCIWCKKTQRLLDQMGIAYDYINVDLYEGDAKDEIVAEIERWNPKITFPTIVIDNERCIVGFDEEEIVRVLAA